MMMMMTGWMRALVAVVVVESAMLVTDRIDILLAASLLISCCE